MKLGRSASRPPVRRRRSRRGDRAAPRGEDRRARRAAASPRTKRVAAGAARIRQYHAAEGAEPRRMASAVLERSADRRPLLIPLSQARKMFAAASIVTLALGIGANAAVFSILHAVLLSSAALSRERPAGLGALARHQGNAAPHLLSYPTFFDFRRANRVFEHLACYRDEAVHAARPGPAARVSGEIVSWDFFAALGVAPALGRGLSRPRNTRNARGRPQPRAVVHALRRGRSNGRPGDLDRPGAVCVVGSRRAVSGSLRSRGRPVSRCAGRVAARQPVSEQRGARMLDSVARLKPGVSTRRARRRHGFAGRRASLPSIRIRIEHCHARMCSRSSTGSPATRRPLMILLGRRRPGAAHCVRQHRQPAPGAGHGSCAGACDADGHRREPGAADPAGADREPRDRASRECGRRPARGERPSPAAPLWPDWFARVDRYRGRLAASSPSVWASRSSPRSSSRCRLSCACRVPTSANRSRRAAGATRQATTRFAAASWSPRWRLDSCCSAPRPSSSRGSCISCDAISAFSRTTCSRSTSAFLAGVRRRTSGDLYGAVARASSGVPGVTAAAAGSPLPLSGDQMAIAFAIERRPSAPSDRPNSEHGDRHAGILSHDWHSTRGRTGLHGPRRRARAGRTDRESGVRGSILSRRARDR